MLGIYHYIAFALFGTFALLDMAGRARVFPDVPYWKLQGIAFTALYFAIATLAPLLWDGFLGQHQLVDASPLPFWAQVMLGFLLYEFLIYAWHRTMHAVDPLWRWMHQMHHSAERVDIWGAFYFHPFDMIGWALVGSMALVLGIGLTGEAALTVTVLATFCAMFQHSNMKTPAWLGWFIMRPENHALHHERGVHGYNYGDVPWFDMILGTYRNPREWNGKAGFFDGSSSKLGDLLIGRKIA